MGPCMAFDYPAPSAADRSSGRKSGSKVHTDSNIEGPTGQFSKFSDIGKLKEGKGGKGRQTVACGYHRAD